MRIALGIEYCGTNYYGWQSQVKTRLPTIQVAVEDALSKIANQKIAVTCAGRTDVGVHAMGQVVHFDYDATTSKRQLKAWVLGSNNFLPADIRVKWAKKVPDHFHARYSATARHYRYFIYNHRVKSAILDGRITFYPKPLNPKLMQEAAPFFLGEQDFTALRGSDCQSKSTCRNLTQLTVKKCGKVITIDVVANAFLLHMVRNIVGVLLEIGQEKKPPAWVKEVLQSRDRKVAGTTADAHGLYLLNVSYPREFRLPLLKNQIKFLL